jgi:hypothetical protein
MIKKGVSLSMVCIFCLLLVCCGSDKDGKVGDLLTLVPAESTMVASVNLKAVVDNGYYDDLDQEMLAKSEEWNNKFKAFMEKANIDPKKDLNSMVFAYSPKEGPGEELACVLVNGNFDNEALLNAVRSETDAAIQEKTYKGSTLYVSAAEPDKGWAFPAEGCFAIAGEPMLQKVLDIREGDAKDITDNKDMMNMIDRVDKNVMVWGCGLVPQDVKEEATSGNPMFAAFNDVNALIFTLDGAQGVNVNLQALCSSADSAQKVGEALNGLKMMAGALAAQEPLAGEFLEKIQIEPTGDLVALSADIPKELIEKAKAKAREFQPPAGDM